MIPVRSRTIIGGIGVALFLSFITPVMVVGSLALVSSSNCQLTLPENAPDSFKTYQQAFSETDRQEQHANAELIVSIGSERGFSSYSIAIAVATAIQESDLRNLSYGDRDSLGLYQQRPSQGWGTAEQIKTPSYAINTFYDRLETVENRDQRQMIDVAMAIQIPNETAYLSRWQWDGIATDIVDGRGSDAATDSAVTCGSVMIDGWRAPLDTIVVTSPYGMRIHPTLGIRLQHNGVDFEGDSGQPIYAVNGGSVTYRQISNLGLGNYIEIDHGNGIVSGYGHMSGISSLGDLGDQVNAGDIIGYVGTTGRSTGNHLHFVIKVDGESTDPMAFYADSLGMPLQ